MASSSLSSWYRPKAAYGISAGNAVGAVPVGKLYGDRWAAFDRLPPLVRAAVRSTVVDTCVLTIAQLLDPIRTACIDMPAAQLVAFAAEALPGYKSPNPVSYVDRIDIAQRLFVQQMRKSEEGEILRFSETEKVKRGMPTPHVAADATVLRESEVSGRPRPVKFRSADRARRLPPRLRLPSFLQEL